MDENSSDPCLKQSNQEDAQKKDGDPSAQPSFTAAPTLRGLAIHEKYCKLIAFWTQAVDTKGKEFMRLTKVDSDVFFICTNVSLPSVLFI